MQQLCVDFSNDSRLSRLSLLRSNRYPDLLLALVSRRLLVLSANFTVFYRLLLLRLIVPSFLTVCPRLLFMSYPLISSLTCQSLHIRCFLSKHFLVSDIDLLTFYYIRPNKSPNRFPQGQNIDDQKHCKLSISIIFKGFSNSSIQWLNLYTVIKSPLQLSQESATYMSCHHILQIQSAFLLFSYRSMPSYHFSLVSYPKLISTLLNIPNSLLFLEKAPVNKLDIQVHESLFLYERSHNGEEPRPFFQRPRKFDFCTYPIYQVLDELFCAYFSDRILRGQSPFYSFYPCLRTKMALSENFHQYSSPTLILLPIPEFLATVKDIFALSSLYFIHYKIINSYQSN